MTVSQTVIWNTVSLFPKLIIVISQRTFQRQFDVIFRWYDAATQHNVKSTLKQRCIRQRWNLQRSTTFKRRCVFQRWIEQRCHFKRQFSQHWETSKQRCKYDYLKKKIFKPWFKNNIIFLSFEEYAGLKIFFIFSPF